MNDYDIVEQLYSVFMTNSLGTDQGGGHFVRNYLVPNYLQRLSADNKSCH